MPKIYVKTIVLVAFAVFMVFLRMKLLVFSVPLPPKIFDVVIGASVIAIVINEKLTRSERWKVKHYLLLLAATCLIAWIRVSLKV
jgi:hypothetical protein